MKMLERLAKDDRGATAVEYGLIVALIVIAMIGGLTNFSMAAKAMYNGIATNVSKAM